MSTPLSPHPETSRDPEDLSRLVELVLQLQVSVLKKERFVSVLGADAVDSCVQPLTCLHEYNKQ